MYSKISREFFLRNSNRNYMWEINCKQLYIEFFYQGFHSSLIQYHLLVLRVLYFRYIIFCTWGKNCIYFQNCMSLLYMFCTFSSCFCSLRKTALTLYPRLRRKVSILDLLEKLFLLIYVHTCLLLVLRNHPWENFQILQTSIGHNT